MNGVQQSGKTITCMTRPSWKSQSQSHVSHGIESRSVITFSRYYTNKLKAIWTCLKFRFTKT